MPFSFAPWSRRRARAAAVLVGLLCAAALAWNYRLRRPLAQLDEGAWIFSTYYYRLAFIDGDLRSPAWSDVDAYDHPPLAKFLFGAVLPERYVAHSLTAKHWWLARAFVPLPGPQAAFEAQVRALVDLRTLQRARLASTLAVGLACLFLAALGAGFLGLPAASVAALLLVLMPLTRELAAQAVADGPFIGAIVAVAFIQSEAARSASAGRRRPLLLAALAGLLSGLAFDIKISAIGEVVLLAAGWGLSVEPALAAQMTVLALGVGALAAYAANPSLYPAPFGFVEGMFRHRMEAWSLQRQLFVGDVHPNLAYRSAEFLKGVFHPADSASLVTCAATAVLAVCGLAALPGLWRRGDGAGRSARVAVIQGAGWTAAAFATFALRWERYLFPALPFVCLLAACGLEDVLRRGRRGSRRLLAAAAVAAAVSLLAAPLSTNAYWTSRRQLYEPRLQRALDIICSRSPSDCPPLASR